MFYAFYYNNLFPEQVFHISRSIEMILGPIIGGIGTLFGPILGAFLLTGLAEALTELLTRARHRRARAPSRCSTASACCVVVMALPGRHVAVARAQRSASTEREP